MSNLGFPKRLPLSRSILASEKSAPGSISDVRGSLGALVPEASAMSKAGIAGLTGVHAKKSASLFAALLPYKVMVIAPSPPSPDKLKIHLTNAIKSASQQRTPMEAITEIGEWWSIIDDAAGLAEGRTRLLLKKIKAPLLATEPAWVAEQVKELSSAEDDSAPSHPLAIDTARRIIRACLARVGGDVKYSADLRRGPLGRVAISWDLDRGHLHWMVTAADLPWPGLLVHSVVVGMGSKPSARVHHFVEPVIEEFVGLTRRAA